VLEGDDAEVCVVAMGGIDRSFVVVVESFDGTGKHSSHVHTYSNICNTSYNMYTNGVAV